MQATPKILGQKKRALSLVHCLKGSLKTSPRRQRPFPSVALATFISLKVALNLMPSNVRPIILDLSIKRESSRTRIPHVHHEGHHPPRKMPPFLFSALAEKLENAYGAIQSAMVLFPEDPNLGPAWFTVARDQHQHSPIRFQTDRSSFSSEETDNSESFRSIAEEGGTRDADTDMTPAKLEAAREGAYVVSFVFSFYITNDKLMWNQVTDPTTNDVWQDPPEYRGLRRR